MADERGGGAVEDGGDAGLVPELESGMIGYCARCGGPTACWVVGRAQDEQLALHPKCTEGWANGERAAAVEPRGAYARRRT